MNTQTACVGSAMLESLLSVAQRDPEGAVRFAALDTASRLPLSRDAWRAFWTVLRHEIDASRQDPEARARVLALAVRIPLLSVRREVRRIAANADDPAAASLAEALAVAGDPSQIARLLKAVDAGQWEVLEWLAAMPLEAEGVAISRIPVPAQDADAEVRLWYALVAARLGEFAALDAFLDGREQEPGIFWGSPGVPYARIAAMRPVPRALDEHLRAALTAVARLEDHSVERAARIIIWAATGMADADGRSIEPAAAGAGVAAPAPAADAATKKQVQAAHAGARDLLRDLTGDAGTVDLAFMPQSEVAGFLTEVVVRANAMAQELPPNVPANEALGNRMIDVVGALPRAMDWPVAALFAAQLESARSALDDKQLAWVIARGPAAHAIRELASLVVPDRPTADRLRILDIGAFAADELAGRGGSPYRGAAPDAAGAATGRGPLIDDAELVLMAEAEDGAAAIAPSEDDELGIGPATRAPAASAGRSEIDERRVNAWILHDGERRSTFRVGTENLIRCWIGLPEKNAAVADKSIPTVFIPPTGLVLLVQLYWRDWNGQDHTDSQHLLLPAGRTARSGDCDLHLSIPAGERYVSAEILFRYRGRVFEAVRVEAFVLDANEVEGPQHEVRVRVQASRREVIEQPDSRLVDASFIYGDDRPAAEPGAAAEAPPSLRVFGREGGKDFDLSDAKVAIEWLNEVLFVTEKLVVRRQAGLGGASAGGAPGSRAEAALDADDPDVRSLLRDMARHGAGLYNQLVDQGFKDPGARIQVLNSDPKTYVPLEFVYDRGYPVSHAQVCQPGLKALASGEAACPVCRVPVPESERSSAQVICPFGFWSMRKVIERVGTGLAGHASAPASDRRSLPVLDSVAFASSHLVPEEERKSTREALEKSFSRLSVADDWQQWVKAVAEHPSLLILLPHHGIQAKLDYLEIGDQKLPEDLGKLSRAQIIRQFVNADGHDPGPIVLLLGCQTAAATETGYVQMTQLIYQQCASIVLGTLAEILGRDAAPLVRELVAELVAVTDSKSDLGTIMLRVRRRMLARGNLIALCLVALGDAEWHLAPRPNIVTRGATEGIH